MDETQLSCLLTAPAALTWSSPQLPGLPPAPLPPRSVTPSINKTKSQLPLEEIDDPFHPPRYLLHPLIDASCTYLVRYDNKAARLRGGGDTKIRFWMWAQAQESEKLR